MSSFPGGKNGAGTYHKIINLMPPHSLYIEPFAGGAAIYRLKKPAPKSILIDLDPSPLSAVEYSAGLTVICDDGILWLEEHAGSLPADALIYCDPPYMMNTRKSGPLYKYEMTDGQHARLLSILQEAPCFVMVSGYWSALYAAHLQAPRWRRSSFLAMTRGGTLAQEWLWMNYEPPVKLHDSHLVGKNFRERERIKRRVQRWTAKLEKMEPQEREALRSAVALSTTVSNGDAREKEPSQTVDL